MKEIIEFVKGKKTYIIAAIMVILGTLQGLDIFVLPKEVWVILGGLGFASLRSGVDKISGTVKKMKKAVEK